MHCPSETARVSQTRRQRRQIARTAQDGVDRVGVLTISVNVPQAIVLCGSALVTVIELVPAMPDDAAAEDERIAERDPRPAVLWRMPLVRVIRPAAQRGRVGHLHRAQGAQHLNRRSASCPPRNCCSCRPGPTCPGWGERCQAVLGPIGQEAWPANVVVERRRIVHDQRAVGQQLGRGGERQRLVLLLLPPTLRDVEVSCR